MCGIAGAIALADGARITAGELTRMAAVLGHRGPDGSGTHLEPDGRAGLAHARLSIIDLAGGAQPMQDGADAVWIAFNGEIFNFIELRAELEARRHRFTSASDTEVLIRAYLEWGDDFVGRLNGQFAFALLDRRAGRRRLLLIRDRVGILPLFHARDRGRLVFASEVKALLPCLEAPPALDPRALGQIFTYWAPIGTRTAFAGVAEVPPGRMLVIEDGRIDERTYWRWEYPEDGAYVDGDPEVVAEELAELLADAVRLRLRSDVPVGAYLSGGLDSSILAALARAEAGTRLQTFSIRFEQPEFDEGAHQRRMAEHLDVAHSEILCTPQDIARSFPAVIRHTETPILRAAPAPMFLLSGLVRRSGFKVVLTGEGADEAFGGYDLFKEAKIRSFWARQPDSRCRPLLLKRLYPWLGAAGGAQPLGHLKAFYGEGIDDPGRFDFSHLPRWRTTAQCKMFFTPDFAAAAAGDSGGCASGEIEASLPPGFPRWHAFNRAQYLEATILLPKYLLNSQGDRMLMAHSVEGRFPFLDHRVIEFANRLHPRLKMRVLDEKHVLKRAAARLVPKEVLERPKQPYRAPDHAAFLAADAPDYVHDLLGEAALRRTGVFDPGRVGLLVKKLRAAPSSTIRDQMALMGILSTQLWCYEFAPTGGQSPGLADLPCSQSPAE